jgi:hypothetical protein
MSIESRDIWKIGIWCLFPVFVVVAIILPAIFLPLLLTFTLILILEILFVFSLNPQQLVYTAYHFEIRPRSPPNR